VIKEKGKERGNWACRSHIIISVEQQQRLLLPAAEKKNGEPAQREKKLTNVGAL